VQGLVGSLGGVVELVWAEVVGPEEAGQGSLAEEVVLGSARTLWGDELVALQEAKVG
jgi:hypothetical protein